MSVCCECLQRVFAKLKNCIVDCRHCLRCSAVPTLFAVQRVSAISISDRVSALQTLFANLLACRLTASTLNALDLVPTFSGVRTPRSAEKFIRNHFLWRLGDTKKVFRTPSESSENCRILPYRSESATPRWSRLRHLGDRRHKELEFRQFTKKLSSQHDRSLSQDLTAKYALWGVRRTLRSAKKK